MYVGNKCLTICNYLSWAYFIVHAWKGVFNRFWYRDNRSDNKYIWPVHFEINQNESPHRPLRTDKKDDQEPLIRHSAVHFNNTNQVKTFSSNEKPEEIYYHTNTYGINYKHQRKKDSQKQQKKNTHKNNVGTFPSDIFKQRKLKGNIDYNYANRMKTKYNTRYGNTEPTEIVLNLSKLEDLSEENDDQD